MSSKISMYSDNRLASAVEQTYYVTSLLILKPQDVLPAAEVLLRHAVHLLSINQAGLVRLQNPKRRVVLEGCEDVGAGILPLVQEPNTGWDSHNSDDAEDDQDGQHWAGLCRTSNDVRDINRQLYGIRRIGFKFHLLCLTFSATERQKHPVRGGKTIQTQFNGLIWKLSKMLIWFTCSSIKDSHHTLLGLTDHSILHFIQTADLLPLAGVAVQNPTRVDGWEVWRGAVLPVGEIHITVVRPSHGVTWQNAK